MDSTDSNKNEGNKNDEVNESTIWKWGHNSENPPAGFQQNDILNITNAPNAHIRQQNDILNIKTAPNGHIRRNLKCSKVPTHKNEPFHSCVTRAWTAT